MSQNPMDGMEPSTEELEMELNELLIGDSYKSRFPKPPEGDPHQDLVNALCTMKLSEETPPDGTLLLHNFIYIVFATLLSNSVLIEILNVYLKVVSLLSGFDEFGLPQVPIHNPATPPKPDRYSSTNVDVHTPPQPKEKVPLLG